MTAGDGTKLAFFVREPSWVRSMGKFLAGEDEADSDDSEEDRQNLQRAKRKWPRPRLASDLASDLVSRLPRGLCNGT